jgi:hypothetical protein
VHSEEGIVIRYGVCAFAVPVACVSGTLSHYSNQVMIFEVDSIGIASQT